MIIIHSKIPSGPVFSSKRSSSKGNEREGDSIIDSRKPATARALIPIMFEFFGNEVWLVAWVLLDLVDLLNGREWPIF